jgi:hypothetical protein
VTSTRAVASAARRAGRRGSFQKTGCPFRNILEKFILALFAHTTDRPTDRDPKRLFRENILSEAPHRRSTTVRATMRADSTMRTRKRCAVTTLAVVAALGAGRARASAVRSEGFTVPALSCFGTTATMKYDMTSVTSDLSGITYNPETGTLFAVNNGDRIVYEIQYPNTLVNQ